MPFPRKRLMFEQTGVDQGLLNELIEIKKFLRGIDDTSATWLKTSDASKRAFVPMISHLYKMSVLPNGIKFKDEVARSTQGQNYNIASVNNKGLFNSKSKGINTIFKVNVPGFVYRQHFKGGWNPGPEVAVFVAYFSKNPTKAEAAAAKWLCLFRSRGNGDYALDSPSNNHANQFFPINPGGHTYMLVMTSGKYFNDTAAERQCLMYVPAFGYAGNPLTKIGEWATKTNTTGTIDVAERLSSIKEVFS